MLCEAMDLLHFVAKEKPANLDAFRGNSYMGAIKPKAGVCWVSFPGKFAAGWEALIDGHHEDSVACVFLDDPESGLGQHYFPDSDSSDRCLCAEIYGERDYKALGYLMKKGPCTGDEKEKLEKRARAMNAHIVFGNPSEDDEKKAKKLWEDNKKRASWGCLWFQVWLQRVQKAVNLNQRLRAVYFPGEKGQGKVPWNMLATANLWDGIGCGGSQKGELAKLDQLGWQYEDVDVTMFLSDQFKVGETVDALNSADNTFTKAIITHIPGEGTPEPKWMVRCKKTQAEFETSLVRHTTELFDTLLQKCGEDSLKKVIASSLNLKVHNIEEGRSRSGAASLAVKVDIRRVQDVQRLRDAVLSEDMAAAINRSLLDQHQVGEEISVDKADFLNHFARSLMTFAQLTQHQQIKLKEICAYPDENVHLRAPAGAGKTLVALRYALRKLRASGCGLGKLLYICPQRPLIFHFVQWLLIQAKFVLPNDLKNDLLQGLVVMHDPYNKFMKVVIQDSCIVLEELVSQPEGIILAILDEAHAVLGTKSSLFREVDARQKLMLSDISQSSSLQIDYPKVREVTLTEVIRSTKRVVLGAGAFGLQDSQTITCLGTTGPPLKSFLFAAPEDDQDIFAKFADKTLEAIWHIARTYPSISLQQHIALIVPDEKFYNDFKPHVMKRLEEDFFPCCKIISFEDALRHIPEGIHRDVRKDAFILDWDENAKGLEKMFVVSIGFDMEIKGDSNNSARSRLYHTITRAQLQTFVVDRFVRGGWLEFLSTLELKKDSFEQSTAEAEVRKDAARKVVDVVDAWPTVGVNWDQCGTLKCTSFSFEHI
eukprot:Skav211868  [mRNA]  locus=scaffold1431:166491:168956:- [translate_table: standard]